jgi:hypothetical protein
MQKLSPEEQLKFEVGLILKNGKESKINFLISLNSTVNMESIINFKSKFLIKIKEGMDIIFSQVKEKFGHFSVMKNLFKIVMLTCIIGTCPFVSYSQTVEERQEYYKKMISKGETTLKSFNTIKASIHDLVFTDEHDGYNDRTEFQCVYELFLINFYERLDVLNVEFNKMNNFRGIPEMDFLKQMNSIQEKKNALLTEGIRYFEEISTEVNSKPFKRWDARVIDAFLPSSFLNVELQMFKRLRPVCYEVFLLNRSRSIIAYLKCAYANWHLMISKEFTDLSNSNPMYNYNMVSHKLALEPKLMEFAVQMNQLKIDISNEGFKYSNVVFSDYVDNSIFSSWMVPVEVKNMLIDQNVMYSEEMANSSNALALAYLVSSLDFKNSLLSQLFNNTQFWIFSSYDPKKDKFNFDALEYSVALEMVNTDARANYLLKNKNNILNLSKIVPNSTPWFYINEKPKVYLENVANFDRESFLVFEIKHDLILASAYFKSICNDFLMSGLNDKVLKDWYNQAMEKTNLKAYYQNDYMLQLNKMNDSIWAADKIQLSSILDELRIIKLSLRTNRADFIGKYKLLTNSNDLIPVLNQNSNTVDNTALDLFIISYNNGETRFLNDYNAYIKGEKTISILNSLGWRCLLNFEYQVAAKFLKEATKVSNDNIMITLNLAHAYLLNGDLKKAKDLYLKFPLDAISPELNMNVKTIILNDFGEFVSGGVNPSAFEVIRKELGL